MKKDNSCGLSVRLATPEELARIRDACEQPGEFDDLIRLSGKTHSL